MDDHLSTSGDRPNLPVPIGAPKTTRSEGARAASASKSAFSAQVLGEGGARRGLRGGQPVLQAARSAYLATQWSGDADRRPAPGRLALERL